jgi:UDP-N-acetylglucosamine 2-epimerase (non-hydrolysing)
MLKAIKIINIVGARPNMMKMAPLIAQMRKHKNINFKLVHTGQHYDVCMSRIFFDQLSLPRPDIYLGVGSGSHARQTSRVMSGLEKVFIDERPDLVIVVGDVNSTLAAAIAAVKLHIPLAHIEAGLRSFDRLMPEEINRLVTDSVSDYLFAPSQDAVKNLNDEGLSKEKIFFVGNIMIDTLLRFKQMAGKRDILKRLNLKKCGYALITLHRPSNVDNKGDVLRIFNALKEIQKKIKIVFPMHPRTRKMALRHKLFNFLKGMQNLMVVPPLGYLDFLKLMVDTRIILTDSGGIQEEATALRVPCLTLRDTTERPVTLTLGTNILVGKDTGKIIEMAEKRISGGGVATDIPKLWDGMTAQRIIAILLRRFS